MPMHLAKRRIIRPSRGPCMFPGGNPGFNRAHPAAAGIVPGHGFSGVAVSGGADFVNLLTGQTGVNAFGGAIFSGVHSVLGPVMDSGGTGSAKAFAGQLSAVETAVTIAAILRVTSYPTTFTGIFCTGGTNGYAFDVRSNNQILIFGTGAGSGPASANFIALGVPFFLAVSGITGQAKTNFLIKNLNDNTILYDQNTGTTLPAEAANGTTYGVGVDLSSSAIDALQAAVMFAPTYLSREQLLLWAADPWSFWYPK